MKTIRMVGTLIVLMIINPHRAPLVILHIVASLFSWLAGRLEYFSSWMEEWIERGNAYLPLVGKSLSRKLQDDEDEDEDDGDI